jgi:hypothetical protein
VNQQHQGWQTRRAKWGASGLRAPVPRPLRGKRMRLIGGRLARPFDKGGPSHFHTPFKFTRAVSLSGVSDKSVLLADHGTPLAWLLAWEAVAEREARHGAA